MGWMKLRDTWFTFRDGELMLSACGRDAISVDDDGWSIANNFGFPGVRAFGDTMELALEAYATECRERANKLLWMADAAGRAIEAMEEEGE